MITAKFSVHPVDKGWVVRIGPDVLGTFRTKGQALLWADYRAAVLRLEGGQATVVQEPQAAFESATSPRPPGNLGLQVTLSTTPDAARPASKGNG